MDIEHELPQGPLIIPVRSPVGADLGTLWSLHASVPLTTDLIDDLTQWRNTNRQFFATHFNATMERTLSWINTVIIPDPTRLLFMIDTPDGTHVGHLGVTSLNTSRPELDNMIRGRSAGGPKIMYWAEVALVHWLFTQPQVLSVHLKVFSHNWIPISIHRSIGFTDHCVQRLVRRDVGGEIHLVPAADAVGASDCTYLEMMVERQTFAHFYELAFAKEVTG